MKVLDKGYVDKIETWGSDAGIIEAARMSTNKGFRGWGTSKAPGDEKLLAYLYNNRHMTPFEMAGATFEIKSPIFVFREWHRHRTQSYNEMSARYTPLPDENYLPDPCITLVRANTISSNKQAGSTKDGTTYKEVDAWLRDLGSFYASAQALYDKALDAGIPKELARLVVPVGRYSRMRATANLRNWLQFLTLRMDEHAQWEIRQYANAVHAALSVSFPRTMELFDAT